MGNLSNIGSRKPGAGGGVRYLTVTSEQAGQRLDNFLLRELKGLPKSRVYRLVRRGEVRVNLGRAKAGYRLKGGDSIRIPPVRLGAPRETPAATHLETGPVLFEDAHLLVLDKPSGVTVHKGTGVHAGVIEALRARRPDLPFLELVHRLDRDTSGCLILAKSRAALTGLHAALRRDAGGPTVSKHYLALVRGDPGADPIRVRAGLKKNAPRGGERVVVVSEDGGRAETILRPTRRGPDLSLIDIELVTGRTHQARVHAAHVGHPIAGDSKYGDREFNKSVREKGIRRLALHAHTLEFTHPVTGSQCRIVAPPPAIFETAPDGPVE